MSYHTDNNRCSLIDSHPKAADSNRVHEDRGDGLGLCAIGTQHPDPKEWQQTGPGDVDCLLCADIRTTATKSHGRVAQPKKLVSMHDERIAESLDDRAARMRREREEKGQ